ncbi:MAG: cobalt-precorrin-6A reductase [Microcoleaceae cyanobacterium]
MSQIWLIGGTSESVVLAKAIIAAQINCVVTVTTDTAKNLYPLSSLLTVWVGCLDENIILSFLQENKITAILDASHPFAVEISTLAIATAKQYNIPYLRYERSVCETVEFDNNILHLDSFETLLSGDYLNAKRVMLTLGYRHLHQFKKWQNHSTLFIRILPSIVSLEAALTAGFTPDRIIAIRPPISIELEKALWQQWNISLVITKASGKAGGENIKRKAATELGIPLIIIDRPHLSYPQITTDINTAIKFCQNYLN